MARRTLALAVVASSALWAGCESDETLDDFTGDGGQIGDGADGAQGDGQDGTTGDGAADGSVGLDGGAGDGNPGLDAGEQPDVTLGTDCVEELVWDPMGRTDVESVVVASQELSGWSADLSPPMRLESDGKYHLTIGMYMTTMAYKFVVNGTEWMRDPAECHTEGDGNGGRNSILYACQERPECPVIGECPAPAPTDLGDGCSKTVTYDPEGRTDVERVVLVGAAPLTWDYESCDAIPLAKGDDGLWRVSIELPLLTSPLEYKFVVNNNADGNGWTADVTNCHEANTNSLLYCQDEPACGSDSDGGTPDGGLDADAGVSDGGVEMDASTSDAGTSDAGAEPFDFDEGTDCVETFEFDPAAYPDLPTVNKVEVRGNFANHVWTADAIVLNKDPDNIYRARVRMNTGNVEYKLVVNGDKYRRDRAYCQAATNGDFESNSVRKACTGTPVACCEGVTVSWDPVAAGCPGAVNEAWLSGPMTGWGDGYFPMTKQNDGTFTVQLPYVAPDLRAYKIRLNSGATWVDPATCTDGSDGTIAQCN